MANRKLGRPTDQRKAMLRNQVTNLIWYGKIETTLARAKEVSSIAEHLIALAARECDNTVEATKETHNDKHQIVTLTVVNDQPSRLDARRRMMAYLYNIPNPKKEKESRSEYRERTGMVKNPVVEKLMRELGPKYKKRKEEKGGIGGGYTRIVKIGPRRGDAAEMVILELV
jgi:large subunit ribosomal protein L17